MYETIIQLAQIHTSERLYFLKKAGIVDNQAKGFGFYKPKTLVTIKF